MYRRHVSAPSLALLRDDLSLVRAPNVDVVSDVESVASENIDALFLEGVGDMTSPVSAPESSPTVVRRERTRKKRMAPPPPTQGGCVSARPASLDCTNRSSYQTSTDSETPTEVPSEGKELQENVLLLDPEGEPFSNSPHHSPKDKSRLQALKMALRSPRNIRKNSKKWKEENESKFRYRKNATIIPPDFSMWTFADIPENLVDVDAEFEIQRIPDYEKFLSGVLDSLSSSDPDYEDVVKTQKKVQNMVREREDELKEAENDHKMESVQDRFPNDDLQLREQDKNQKTKSLPARRKSAPSAVIFRTLGSVKAKGNTPHWSQYTTGRKDGDPNKQGPEGARCYIMEGPVQFSTGMQTQDRYMFLFNDLLLVAKQKSNTAFKLKNRIPVCDIWIANCIDVVSEASRSLDKSFVLGWPTTNVVATFKDPDTKELWLKKLQEQIQEEKSREDHQTVVMKVVGRDVGSKTADQPSVSTCGVQITNKTEAKDVLKVCLEQLQIRESEAKDYQLWVRSGKEGPPYPLIGHEFPYSIKASHVRDILRSRGDDTVIVDMDAVMDEAPASSKCEFILKPKKSQKKHSLDETYKAKKGKKSAWINLFRRPRDDKAIGAVVPPLGKLFGHSLADVCSEGEDVPKPILDLLGILFREGPYTMGIFRRSANARMCREVRTKLDNGEDLTLEDSDTILAGGVLKEYLRAIPKSLLQEELYDEWLQKGFANLEEKTKKFKRLLEELPPKNYQLLRHVICVLHNIQKHEDINRMSSKNLGLCIAPSLLWPKGGDLSMSSSIGPVIEYMIDNCTDLFGADVVELFGEPVEHKGRQDSGTDSDSMHSVLSMPETSNGLRRDDSSMDSLVERDLYSAEADSSPKLAKSHLSPSNLSRDSGLTLSDTQLYDDEVPISAIENGKYNRSTSHYMERDTDRVDGDMCSRSLNEPIDSSAPRAPPRHKKRKPKDFLSTSSLDLNPYQDQRTGNTAPTERPSKLMHINAEFLRHARSHPPFGNRVSTGSIQSVTESMGDENELRELRHSADIGMLIKSASGSHLYLNEDTSQRSQQARAMRERFVRQASVTDSTPPLSPQSKYSYSSSRDSVLSDSSSSFVPEYSRSSSQSAPQTPEELPEKMPPWLPDTDVRERSQSDIRLHASLNLDTGKQIPSPSRLSASYNSGLKSVENVRYLVSPPGSPSAERKQALTKVHSTGVKRSVPIKIKQNPMTSQSRRSKDEEEVVLGSSPKISITLCSSGSDEQLDSPDGPESSCHAKSPPLEIPQSRQFTLLSKGLEKGSPPPRVLLQSLHQRNSPRKDFVPLRASHDSSIVSQVRRSSWDSNDNKNQNDTSAKVTKEAENPEGIHKPKFTIIHRTSLQQYPSPGSSRLAASMMDLNSSQNSGCLSPRDSLLDNSRPNRPPSYQMAVQRKHMLKAGIPLEISDHDTEKQIEASKKAKQLYEESLQRYMQEDYDQRHNHRRSQQQIVTVTKQDSFSKDISRMEVVPVSHELRQNHQDLIQCSSGPDVSEEDVYVTLRRDPKKMYEESMQRYHREVSKVESNPLPSGNLHSEGKFSSRFLTNKEEQISSAHIRTSNLSKGRDDLLSVPTVNLHRSLSDSSEHLNKLGSWSPRSKTYGEENSDVKSKFSCDSFVTRERSDSNPVSMSYHPHTDIFYQPEEERKKSVVVNSSKVVSSTSTSSSSSSSPSSTMLHPPPPSSSRNSSSNQNGSTGRELPWSVANLRKMYDQSNQDVNNSSSFCTSEHNPSQINAPSLAPTSRPAPPPYVDPPPFKRIQDPSRCSISSNSSAGSSSTGCNSTPIKSQTLRKFGPQCALDYSSFSSSEDLDSSFRFGRARSESGSGMSDQECCNLTEVSYV